MEKERKTLSFPKGFFSQPRKIINSKKALKDVVPIDWNNTIKNRKESDKQLVKLVKKVD